MLQNANGQGYVFMDQKSWEGFYKRLPETGVSHEDADKYLAQDGKTAPLFVKGATVEEVAAKAGINAAALKATVARYNGFVEKGHDDDFEKPKLKRKIEKGPFYAAWCTVCTHDTYAGLRINGKCQVVDLAGKVILGLYCGGESAGGSSQHGMGRCFTAGYIIGGEVVKG